MYLLFKLWFYRQEYTLQGRNISPRGCYSPFAVSVSHFTSFTVPMKCVALVTVQRRGAVKHKGNATVHPAPTWITLIDSGTIGRLEQVRNGGSI